MITALGYITLYLLVGVVLLPLGKATKRAYPKGHYYGDVFQVLLWPLVTVIDILLLWLHYYKKE